MKCNEIVAIILLSLLLGVCLGKLIYEPKDKELRLDRVENLMNYNTFTYAGIGINENMTLSQTRTLYYSRLDYARMFAKLSLNYVCDGTGDEVLNYIK